MLRKYFVDVVNIYKSADLILNEITFHNVGELHPTSWKS